MFSEFDGHSNSSIWFVIAPHTTVRQNLTAASEPASHDNFIWMSVFNDVWQLLRFCI